MVGSVPVGDGAPIAIQTMTKAPADDVGATLRQIRDATNAGCDIVRCAVPTIKQIDAFAQITTQSPLPVVADVHFDARIAVEAIHAGAAKVRINPGNMADWDAVGTVVEAARKKNIPIRIGVNSGSVKHKNPNDKRSIADALAEEALEYAQKIEAMGFTNLILSLKAPDVATTLVANRKVAADCDYPLHVGVTAAGPEDEALIKSAIGVGALLADGIGDTIRLSFTGPPVNEVVAARKLLHALGLCPDRPTLLSCPTCGRCTVDLPALVREVQARLEAVRAPVTVAVMGCEVNGPGEAKEADVGIAAAGGKISLFVKGERVRTVPSTSAVDELLAEVRQIAEQKGPSA